VHVKMLCSPDVFCFQDAEALAMILGIYSDCED